jgi:regulator of sigma E protease
MASIFANLGTNIFALVIVLGFLIFFHESGHFLMAKLFRVRVLVFSFGFGKRLFGFQHGGTDYRVSLIPLGGYVRMAGDMPEDRITGAGTDAEATGAPDEFLSKKKWQRFLILFAGPFMNLLIAVGILTVVNMVGTEQQLVPPVIGKLEPGDPAEKSGLKVGDRIVAVNNEPITDYDDLKMAISMHAEQPLRVEYIRSGQRQSTILTPKKDESDYGPIGRAGFYPLIEPVVAKVIPGSVADRAGLKPGDRIVAANGKPVTQYNDFDLVMLASENKPIAIEVQRGAQRIPMTLAAAPLTNDSYRGFLPPSEVRKFGLAGAVGESLKQNWKMLKFTGAALKRLVTGQASVKELSGPIQIARISGEMFRRGWIALVGLMAMISLQLGIMNLLPIPVLDGGHIMILLIEGVVRHDLSIRVKERIQQLGFAVLAALMLVVLYNDVIGEIMRLKRG